MEITLPYTTTYGQSKISNKKIKPDLSFRNIPEYERTKHVHRLHPYLGKFIPQLVEFFLKKYFKKGDWILDPFVGSGTLLIEANTLGMNSVGVELSEFNCLISRVKTKKYDLDEVEREIKDILDKTKQFSLWYKNSRQKIQVDEKFKMLSSPSEYLNKWFSKRALQEILFYRNRIIRYKNRDILNVILSRSTRSARLVPHYDLARPKKPVRKKYWCLKHKRYCEPVDEALKFINRYSIDTIRRLREFNKLRTDAEMKVIRADTRKVNLSNYKFDGIFTSPPYVGMIDYHDQHNYAYELFKFKNNETGEIGPMKAGKSIAAKEQYKKDLIKAFKNVSKYLRPKAKIFVVVNDRDEMYAEIAEKSGFRVKDVFYRPVLMRTERDSVQYSESVYFFVKTH